MNEELQKRAIEDMMKRPIPRKRVEVVKLQMIREGKILYGTRRFTSAEGAVEAVRPMLSKTDREMMLVMSVNAKLEPMHHDEWIAEIEAMKEKFPLKHEEGLTGPFVIEEIYKATDGQAVITTDVGQHQMWAAQYYRYTSPRTLLTSGGLGTMGFGLGAAMGAKMGRPDKTVINIAGDGCFRMNMNELATLSRHNIPVIEVVVNNHVLGMVRQWQTLFYGKRYSNTVLQDQADFVKVAEALGVKGIRVTKKEEMGPAIREAIASGKPALIDVWIDCDEKVFPMVPAGAPIEDVFDAEDLAKKEQEKD